MILDWDNEFRKVILDGDGSGEMESEAKPRQSRPHRKIQKTHGPHQCPRMDFLAACIVYRWSNTSSAIHPILHTQHLFLVLLHSAGV
jgi:hypothetical protein